MDTLPDRGQLLALLHGAHRNFRTVRLEATSVRDYERASRAWTLFRRDVEPWAVSETTDVVRTEFRLWFERPGRLREERRELRDGVERETVSVQTGSTQLVVWSRDAEGREQRSMDERFVSSFDQAMLDPARLIASSEFEILERLRFLERPVLRVWATEIDRGFFANPTDVELFSPNELLVDEERGVLLSRAEYVDDTIYALTKLQKVEFDVDLDEALFDERGPEELAGR